MLGLESGRKNEKKCGERAQLHHKSFYHCATTATQLEPLTNTGDLLLSNLCGGEYDNSRPQPIQSGYFLNTGD